MPDVWDTANEARPQPKVYFGQIFTDAFYCILEKGVGKVPFDEGQHDVDRRLTCIKIDGQVTRADGSTYEINREVIAEFRDWAGIVLPSLKVAGIHPRDLNEKWARWEMVNTGRTWIDRSTGETKQGTTFKFLEIYPDEAACRAAETAHYSRSSSGTGQTSQASTLDSTHPMPEEAPANDKQREVADAFLPTLVKLAAGDMDKLHELLKNNDLVSNFYDINHPKVVELVAGEAA